MRLMPPTSRFRILGIGTTLILVAGLATAAIGGTADTIDRSNIAPGDGEASEHPVTKLAVPNATAEAIDEAEMTITARVERSDGLDRTLLPPTVTAVLDVMPDGLEPVDHRSEPGREELLFAAADGSVVTVWWQAVTADVTNLVAGEGTTAASLSDGGSYTVRDTSPAFIQILVTRPGLVLSVVAEKNPAVPSSVVTIDREEAVSIADAALTALGN